MAERAEVRVMVSGGCDQSHLFDVVITELRLPCDRQRHGSGPRQHAYVSRTCPSRGVTVNDAPLAAP